ncbi:MAG: VCBS repeat-containing protein [Desulfobacterales bacterium]|nr:VCBS repeat-containing protein [Desulfobacterales bacterium]
MNLFHQNIKIICICLYIMFSYCVHLSEAIVQAPILKWQKSGCYSSWCETGWYSSPAAVDIDNDGTIEVIASAYSIVVLDGNTGSLKWRAKSGHNVTETSSDNVGRTWPGVCVADVDGDRNLEIITAHGGGCVSVYDSNGHFKTGWPKNPVSNELRGLSVYDLDNNGTMEIIVTAARGNKTNTWVYESNGTLRSGWPQLDNDTGYAWGAYNNNAAIADIDGNGIGNIVVPSDVHYICAYEPNGVQVQADSIYGSKAWGKVGVWVDLVAELRGWGNCGTEHRPNFAECPAVIGDINGDNTLEIIVTGNVHNCATSPYTNLYHGVYIFNSNRTRFKTGNFNWETVPTNFSGPICESYNIIESCMANPVIADIDGDGFKEILFAANDGKVHCVWIDKTEKHNWPYSVYNSGDGFYRFASEPVVADLDNDGMAEIIFGSWTQKGSNRLGKLHILNMYGNLLYEIDVPATDSDWNGILAAPTLANIDSDSDIEIIVNTAKTGICAYDLPGTSNARILWGTGRGNFQRTGSILNTTKINKGKNAAVQLLLLDK